MFKGKINILTNPSKKIPASNAVLINEGLVLQNFFKGLDEGL
jgi:hypothetical protein